MVFVSLIVSMLFVLVYYSIAYNELGTQKIPIGWDTPNYVLGINSVREDGVLETIGGEYNFVNFLYYIIAASLPISSILVETYFPILLAMLAIFSITIFVRNISPKDYPFIAATAVFAASSFLLYRVTADLHANLLGFIFIFSAFAIFIGTKPVRYNQETLYQSILRFVKSHSGLAFVVLIILSTFSHFESSIFFSIIFYIAYSVVYGFGRSKILLVLLILCLIPSLLLFARHSLDVERFPDELRVFHDPLPYEFLLRPLGVYLPLVIAAGVGIFILFLAKSKFFQSRERKHMYFFISFTLVWLALSLVIFRTGYFDEGVYPFSYRAAALLPIPLIASIPFYFVNHINYRSHYFQILSNTLAYGVIFSFGTLNLLYLIENQLPDDSRTFFSDSAYKAIEELQTLNLEQTPIFVYNFHDPYLPAGGISEYPDRWITAKYGDHYRYLGFVDNLARANETAFDNIYSKYYSYAYIRDLKADDIWNKEKISKSPIVVIPAFYNVELFNDNPKFEPVSEHVYLLDSNPEAASTIYKMSSLRSSNAAGWNIIENNMSDNMINVLELYGPPGQSSSMNLSFPTARDTCYELETNYIDGSKDLGFTFTINNDSRYIFYYENPNSVHNLKLPYCASSSITNITITPASREGVPVEYDFVALENFLSVSNRTK
jgi:hypothetical protein